MVLAATSVLAAPTLSDVKVERVRHGFPWTREYSLDVRFRVGGMKAADAGFLKSKVRDKTDGTETLLPVRYMRFPSNGVYRVVWNSREKFGSGDVKLAFENAVPRGVQLWEDGPLWAETNIGAEAPWDAGCYFWWGDTKGYRREIDDMKWDKWSATDGSVSWFVFSEGNTPTYGKDKAILEREGWLTSAGNLSPAHDAACVHWGDGWRMPTREDVQELADNTTTEWTATNGVYGCLVRGKEDYSETTIFLPAAGIGFFHRLDYIGSDGYSWSSTPVSDSRNHDMNFGFAWSLSFDSDYFGRGLYGRGWGYPVRPIREVAD